jgi:SepF-like predicted cell division protein (DUF552 family)
MGFGSKLKGVFTRKSQPTADYIEIDLNANTSSKSRILIRPFNLKVFEDINPILAALREGNTIAIIDIKAIKSKDTVELKRSIAKLKKTVDALEGGLAGFGENIIIAAPVFAEIFRGEKLADVPAKPRTEMY